MNISQQQLTVGIWEVEVHGRLDQTQTPDLNTTLTELINAQQYRLLVNLTETNYINSGGLRCLVSAWRRAKANEGSLALCGLNDRLQEIFAMVGFDKVFQIHTDCAEARARVRPQPRP